MKEKWSPRCCVGRPVRGSWWQPGGSAVSGTGCVRRPGRSCIIVIVVLWGRRKGKGSADSCTVHVFFRTTAPAFKLLLVLVSLHVTNLNSKRQAVLVTPTLISLLEPYYGKGAHTDWLAGNQFSLALHTVPHAHACTDWLSRSTARERKGSSLKQEGEEETLITCKSAAPDFHRGCSVAPPRRWQLVGRFCSWRLLRPHRPPRIPAARLHTVMFPTGRVTV